MKPLTSYPLLSNQVNYAELAVVLRQLQQAILHHQGQPPCAVVELGCYVGTTSVFLQRALHESAADWRLHVYDSFAGLPPKTAADASAAGEQFTTGQLAISKDVLIRNFRHAGLRLPVIHKGWFADLQPADVPPRIGFAFLDGDYYDSIMDSLRAIEPQLTPQATIAIDDYQSPALPGVTRAVHDWLATHPAWQVRHRQSMALLTR